MTEAPEKIWVEDLNKDWTQDSGVWGTDQENVYDVEYTRSDIADGLRDSVVSRNDLLAELARNVEGRQERIDTLEAEVARLRESLGEFARFASKDGLGASVPFGQSKLHKARAALEYKD